EMRLSYNYFADVIRGDVHTNGRTIFGRYYNNAWNPMGASIIGNVTAVRGVGSESIYLDEYDNTINTFLEGNLGLGSVSGTVNGYAASIAFPTQAQITTDLQTSADDYPDYFIHGSNPLYQPYRDTNSLNMPYEVHMTLLGNQVQLDFRGPASSITAPGPLLYTRTLPLPDHKLIYVEGRVTIKGDINGRLTVATSGANIYGNIVIGGNIRYVDNEGDRAYLLKKNGVVVDPDSTGAESWTAANGYTYESNPDYNPTVPSNLTLQARDAVVPSTLSYNLEVHSTALLFGNWYSGAVANGNKGNFRMVGSIVPNGGYGGNKHHYLLSTEIIHDPALLTNAPEWYPVDVNNSAIITTPTFTAWRKF
ncbi:MAG: hypothetical protein AAB019_01325, partial [Planctomycetota bacterium]